MKKKRKENLCHLAGVGEQAFTNAACLAAMLGLIAIPGRLTLPAAGDGVKRAVS